MNCMSDYSIYGIRIPGGWVVRKGISVKKNLVTNTIKVAKLRDLGGIGIKKPVCLSRRWI